MSCISVWFFGWITTKLHRQWNNALSVFGVCCTLSSLWRHSSAIPVFFSLHISTIALPSFFDRKTAQNCKNKPENLRWTFFWLHCSNCLELAASQPESFSLPPNFQKTHFFCQAFWLICTCQLLPVSYSWVCVCMCVCVSWGQGWGLAEMELRVGSNIMIHFLYILLLLVWHMYFLCVYIIHC